MNLSDFLLHQNALLKARFEKHINKDVSGCWLWTAAIGRNGYGKFWMLKGAKDSWISTHRVSWELYNSPIPDDMQVCHSCDVKLCVNPAHLFLGTQMDNVHDMISKGRDKRGPGRLSKVGIGGVYWEDKRQKWSARTTGPSRKLLYWGNDFFEACCARKSWESKNAHQ